MNAVAFQNKTTSYTSGVSKLPHVPNTNSFAENVADSCDLHKEYNTSITSSKYENIKAINSIYIIKQKEEINKFLLENQQLYSTLLEAKEQINARFGDVALYLELHTDFENPEWTQLFLIIKNTITNDEALANLQDIIKKWFFHKEKKVKRLLTISEESQ